MLLALYRLRRLEIASGVEITAIITKQSVDSLHLQEGKQATTVIKTSYIIIATNQK
ncbi:MAG: TOBE domain-containing protein [Nostoc sp.]